MLDCTKVNLGSDLGCQPSDIEQSSIDYSSEKITVTQILKGSKIGPYFMLESIHTIFPPINQYDISLTLCQKPPGQEP